jgi:hypothetical protein
MVALSPTSDVRRCLLSTFNRHNCKILVGIILKTCLHIKSLIQYNFLFRLSQIRESGIQAKLYQEILSQKETKKQTSTIDVSLATVAPILVVLAAGYVTGVFVLLIERCVHGNILKYWLRGCFRRRR